MAAYIIFDVEVTDPTLADDYLKLANESLTPFQSETIVHGGVVEVFGGRLGSREGGSGGI